MSDDVYEHIHEVIPVKIQADEQESTPVTVKVIKVIGGTPIYPPPPRPFTWNEK